MANQLYQQLQKATQSQKMPLNDNVVNAIKNMAGMLQGSANPMQMLQMLGGQNPQIAQILSLIGNSGTSPKDLFMMYAQKMGIDPEQIINLLK